MRKARAENRAAARAQLENEAHLVAAPGGLATVKPAEAAAAAKAAKVRVSAKVAARVPAEPVGRAGKAKGRAGGGGPAPMVE